MKLPRIDLKKLLLYLLFWAVSFYIGLEAFSRTGEIRAIDVVYTFLFLLPFMVVVTIHSYHFIPNYLAKSRFWLYGLSTFLLLGFTVILYSFSFTILSEWLFPNYYLVATYYPHEIVGFALLFLLISSSLEFTRSWFEGLKAKNIISELETEKKASELKALRAQVNPHFLFNSLNTIYSEALKRSDKAPKLILKLSDMLRYVVDKIDQDLVPLEKEIEYLQNFVELHKERLNDPSKVKLLIDGNFSSLKIAPLLLLNFVENAFKHADLTEEDAFISIDISSTKNNLTLKCTNTFFKEPSQKINSSGSGIENAKRRLELAYQGRHSLQVQKTDNTYHLELKLELD